MGYFFGEQMRVRNKRLKTKDTYEWIQVNTFKEFVTALQLIKQANMHWKGGNNIDLEEINKSSIYFIPCQIGIGKFDIVCKIEINLKDLGV